MTYARNPTKIIFGDDLTTAVFELLDECFNKHGHEVMIAGGAVRDFMSGKIPNDIDFATTATPTEMKEILSKETTFKIIDSGIEHGTITIHDSWFGSFEITTLRIDEQCDGRHAKVTFTKDFIQDASRRDFTINAMFMAINGEIGDFFGGAQDILDERIKFVGDPDKRIKEDALRMIRFIRMSCKFDNPKQDTDSANAVSRNSELIKNISVERIWQEFSKVCKDNPENVNTFIKSMSKFGISDKIGFPFSNHKKKNENVCDLDHDIIKKFPEFVIACAVQSKTQANKFCKRFRLSTKERNNMLFFVEHALRVEFEDFTKETVENLVNDGANREHVKAVACFHRQKWLQDAVDDVIFTEFPVNGKDLIANGVIPGPAMGEMLVDMRASWVTSRFMKDKQTLIAECVDRAVKACYNEPIE